MDLSKIQFPINSVYHALVAKVGVNGAVRAVNAAKAAFGNEIAKKDRSTENDTTAVKITLAKANKTRGEMAKIALTQKLVANAPSNLPLRLWYLGQEIEKLANLNLDFGTVTLPADLNRWVGETFKPKAEKPKADTNGHATKREIAPPVTK